MKNVVKVDSFQKATTINTFKRLIGKIEKRNEEIIQNPLKYFREACDILHSKEKKILSIREAAFPKCTLLSVQSEQLNIERFKTVTVTREDYECLVAVRELLNA